MLKSHPHTPSDVCVVWTMKKNKTVKLEDRSWVLCLSCISYRKSVTEEKPWRLKLFNLPSATFLPPGTTFSCWAARAETLFTHSGIALDAPQLWFIGHWMKQRREITASPSAPSQLRLDRWLQSRVAPRIQCRYGHLVKEWQSHLNGHNH